MSDKITTIKPPHRQLKDTYNHYGVFLAGSIEMGKAEDWQNAIEDKLKTLAFFNHIKDEITLYNPRRDDWDSSWTQDINQPQFYEQVTWELDRIQNSDLVIFYFQPTTLSPITLLELGLCIGSKKSCVVCCPQGYWRKGNVDITCYINDVHVVETLDELAEYIINDFINSKKRK